MKILITVALFAISMVFTTHVNAQSKADKILGYYLTYDDETGAEKSQVQIYKDASGKYYGKIVWLKEPNKNGKPKVDDKNPDATYSCYINFESATKVKIRGYIGASWMGLGKTAYWTKESTQRK